MRTFIALKISSDSEKKLTELIGNLKPQLGKISWVKAENIHVTMKFIGELPEASVPLVEKGLKQVASNTSVINVRINSLGCFPNTRKARVLWAGLEGEINKLERLKSGVEAAMERVGLTRDNKKFSPHITLARIKKPIDSSKLENVLRNYQKSNFGTEEFTQISLIKSELRPAGAVYTTLFEAPFLK